MVKIKNLNLEVYGIIYLIRNKVNGKCYVGQTQEEKGFDGRYRSSGEGIERVYKYHKSNKKHNRGYNKHLLRSIEKYGFEAFKINKCLDYAFSLEELNIKEKIYIQLYNGFKNGYNDTEGGEGVKGYIPSEETKQKISKATKGENNAMYGKHHTEETKKKIGEASKGRYCTEESRQKISKALKGKYVGENNPMYGKKGENHPMYGKHHSKETKQKISESKKGKHHSEETKQKMKGGNSPRAKAVYCYEKNEIRLTGIEWADELGLDRSAITKCCKGKLKSTGGYHFRYATEEEIEEYK